ncbi:MAG: geranylgeranylglycerol-phosphate geranylgeranyltransferase [Cyclobacteriaceae bacterium]|nr:geranylgeranylglycerol-phosphate geranylgeranyltransferase [Cyclobacteriaceae bacterium]
MNSLFQLLKLIRFPNLAIIAITQFIVALFLIEPTTFAGIIGDYQLFILIISTLFIASAGYIINDYYDIKIDYVNKPDRVVIGKHIKRRQVLIIHSIFNFTGIALGASISWWIMGVNILAAFLLWLYSNQLKRLPLWGNLTVSFLTGLSVFTVYLHYYSNLESILMYASFAFFISLIREIIKDLEDMEGDEKFGCKTLPISIGATRTKKVIYGINILFVMVVFYLTKNWQMFLPFLITLVIILSFFCAKLFFADKKQNYAQLSSIAKVIMVIGIASMTFT